MLEKYLRFPTTVEECHEVIRECHEVIRESYVRIEELRQVFQEVVARVEKLEIENRELRARLNSDSNNSSKPPSSDFKKKKKQKQSSGKTSGGQKGHRGHYRSLMDESEVDKIVECEGFDACKHCGGEVISSGSGNHVRHQVHELPEVKLEVTEYRLAIGQCQCCLHKQVAALPQGISWGITGPRLTSFMSMMITKYQLSRRMLVEFLKEHFHFQLSLGTVFKKQRLVNNILEKPINELLPIIKEEPSSNIDETSHRQSGKNYWTWVVASKTAAYFKITKSRGKKVLDELMKDFKQVVISDRYAVYNYFDSSQRQLCWAHLIRDFTRLKQSKEKVISRIGKGLLACVSQLFEHWHQFKKGKITREVLLRETTFIIPAVGEYLEQGRYTDPKLRVARFCKNLLDRFSSLWMFLEYEEIEPTNNHAERCLRSLVIWRKKYFTTHSDYGSEYVARTASLLRTSQLRQINAFHYLSHAIYQYFSKQNIPLLIEESFCSYSPHTSNLEEVG